MHYEKLDEKAPVVPMQTSRPAIKNDYRQNSDIRKTRTIVLVLLAIQLVFASFYFIERTVELGRYYNKPVSNREGRLSGSYIGNVIAAAISVVYIIIFIIVVVKYLRIGILIFSWLGLLQLICVIIVIVLSIIAVVAISAMAHSAKAGIVISVAIIIIAALVCLFTILTVIFSFKLAKLIKIQEAYQYV